MARGCDGLRSRATAPAEIDETVGIARGQDRDAEKRWPPEQRIAASAVVRMPVANRQYRPGSVQKPRATGGGGGTRSRVMVITGLRRSHQSRARLGATRRRRPATDRPARDGADSGPASRTSRRRSCRAQKPGRSRVICTGRCAGDSNSITSGTRPPAIDGMARQSEQFLHPDRQLSVRSRLRSRSARASRSAPRNASAPRRRAGAATSMAQGRRSPRRIRPADRSSSAILPVSSGASQSARVAASAASDRSGHSSPSAWRRNMTRSRHCTQRLAPRQAVKPEADDTRAENGARSAHPV